MGNGAPGYHSGLFNSGRVIRKWSTAHSSQKTTVYGMPTKICELDDGIS